MFQNRQTSVNDKQCKRYSCSASIVKWTEKNHRSGRREEGRDRERTTSERGKKMGFSTVEVQLIKLKAG